MSYAIFRMERRQSGAIGGIEVENNRTEKINLPKSDIDWERTKDNQFLKRTDNWKDVIKEQISMHGITKTIRKDAVLVIDALYTASPSFFDNADPETIKSFFRDCFDFHARHFGKDNVLNGVVHYDEKTPHLHMISIPFVQKEDGTWKLSAKDLVGGKGTYHKLQDAFYEEVGQKYDLDRGEIRDTGAIVEHIDTLNLRHLTAIKQVEDIEATISEKDQLLTALDHELEVKSNVLNNAFSIISGFLDHIRGKIDTIIQSVRQSFFTLLDKISSGDELRDSDFTKAGIQLKQIVLHDDTLVDNIGIVPSLHDGTNLSWNGLSPVYQSFSGSHVPFGAYNPSDHTVEIGFDWCDRFSEDNYDNIPFDFDNVLYSEFSELRNLRDDIGDVIGKDITADASDFSDLDRHHDPIDLYDSDSTDNTEDISSDDNDSDLGSID